MNADMMNRIMEARKYQKKAIMALFPDSMAGHIEVIEKEFSAMIMEYAVEIAGQCMQQKSSSGQEESSGQEAETSNDTNNEVSKDANKQKVRHNSKVRKVNIEI